MVRLLPDEDEKIIGHILQQFVPFQSHNGAIAAINAFLDKHPQLAFNPTRCDCCQGKILGFKGKRKGNSEGVAVDLRLPENP